MSGNKYTEIELQREKKERPDLLHGLEAFEGESKELQEQLTNTTNGMSEGLRALLLRSNRLGIGCGRPCKRKEKTSDSPEGIDMLVDANE